MTTATVPSTHVERDAGGAPRIAGSSMKVAELVAAHRAHGWSAEELHFQFPHLSMAQIHGALAYYWDNQAEIDEDIERRAQYAKQARTQAGPSELAARFRSGNRA